MKKKVLVTAPYMQPVIDRFKQLFDKENIEIILPIVHERMDEDDLLMFIEDVDGVICGDDRFTEKVLESAHRLKVLSKWGTGIDSIDQKACQKFGIEIRNTPNAFSVPVADSVIGYMLCFCRKLPWMDKRIKAGVWEKIPGKALHECTLGVIGVGDVGKTVVRRAVGFGMTVYGNDRSQIPNDFKEETGMKDTNKDELLSKSDFVSLNCDLNPTSHHLMNRDTFGLMKASAVIINTSRGPVIKENDLIEALLTNRIAGAALDVFENEPLSRDSPLCQMENVMLASHNANSSPTAWEAVHKKTINNLLEVLRSS